MALSCSQAYGTFVCSKIDAVRELEDKWNIPLKLVVLDIGEEYCSNWLDSVYSYFSAFYECYTLQEGDVIIHYESDLYWAEFYGPRGKKRIDIIYPNC